jgi:hypothetical protein
MIGRVFLGLISGKDVRLPKQNTGPEKGPVEGIWK